jgi:HPt (histidine-containing phosphotransfer) domain-containing protein
MNDYITKPVDPEELFSVLSKRIQQKAEIRMPNPAPGIRHPDMGNQKSDNAFQANLPGIDLESALKRVGGNQTQLRKILAAFARNYSDAANNIWDPLKKGNTAEAGRMLHTLKGIAGNISAKTLYSAAEKLETAVSQNDADAILFLTGPLESALNQVLKSVRMLDDALPDETAGYEPFADTETDIETSAPLILRLSQLLQENDLEAEDYLESLAAHFRGSEFAEPIRKLEEQIDRLDFDKARESLGKLATALNVSIGN